VLAERVEQYMEMYDAACARRWRGFDLAVWRASDVRARLARRLLTCGALGVPIYTQTAEAALDALGIGMRLEVFDRWLRSPVGGVS
jgi:hypothetical protein